MNPTRSEQNEPRWMRPVLVAAGIYNLLWGGAIILFPSALFRFAEMDLPRYPQIWQCVGMIVGVYGVGYLIAATDPLRHWPITLVGLLGKVFGPLGFAGALASGDLPLAFGATIVTNDLIWWLPFAALLYQAFKRHSDRSTSDEIDQATVIKTATSHRGATLAELSAVKPTLVVFLRHTGCTFCRETLAELASRRADLESNGGSLAIVHMSPRLDATQFLAKYGLESVHRFSDPQCEIYSAFGLGRGSVRQLFGPKVWWRGAIAILANGHGIGPLSGDGFRMPGAFLLDRSEIVATFRASSAADMPDFAKLTGLVTPGDGPTSTHCNDSGQELAAQF